jgi:phosphonatase-like hydrolase
MKNTDDKMEFVMFDLIGTTVKESPVGDPVVINSFKNAFSHAGVLINYEQLNKQRGKTKKDAIKDLLLTNNLSTDLADEIYQKFILLLTEALKDFSEMDGATDLFKYLKAKNIKIGIGSGLPIEIINNLLGILKWELSGFDYISSSDELGKGRPDPIMIFDAMKKLKIKSKDKILKVGDTFIDIQEGKNAGVLTAAVLTGTQTQEELEEHQPDFILTSIKEIKNII